MAQSISLRSVVFSVALICTFFVAFPSTSADEGQWPLSMVHKLDLAKAGIKVPASEIFNDKKPSLVDAICRVGGATGSFVSDTGLILTMDRSVGNMLEQTPPFLLGLWLHALVASAEHAALLGWLWLLLRASYPVAFANPSWSPGLWGVQRIVGISWVSFVTWPSYAVVWMLLIGSWRACMDGGGVSS